MPGAAGDHVGLLDSVIARNGKFGFVRVLPSDEKLFWHSSGAAPGVGLAELNEGTEVAFQVAHTPPTDRERARWGRDGVGASRVCVPAPTHHKTSHPNGLPLPPHTTP